MSLQAESREATFEVGTEGSYSAIYQRCRPSFLVLSSKRPHSGKRRSNLTAPTSVSTLSIWSIPLLSPGSPAFVRQGSEPLFNLIMISPSMAATDSFTMTGPPEGVPASSGTYPLPEHPKMPARESARANALKTFSILNYLLMIYSFTQRTWWQKFSAPAKYVAPLLLKSTRKARGDCPCVYS